MHRAGGLGAAFVLALCASVARADFVNGGFEAGNLSNWTASNSSNVSVVTSYGSIPMSPVAGSYFAVLTAPADAGVITNGTVLTLSQTIAVVAGDTLTVSAFFYPTYLYTDRGGVRIVGVGSPWYPTYSYVGSGTWHNFSYTFASSGNFTVQAFVQQGRHFGNGPFSGPVLGVDAFVLTSGGGAGPVPEPGTIALVGLGVAGLAGLVAARRRSRRTAK